MTLNEARKKAINVSRAESCVQHVNAMLEIVEDTINAYGAYVSNWQDNSTVESYENGRRV